MNEELKNSRRGKYWKPSEKRLARAIEKRNKRNERRLKERTRL